MRTTIGLVLALAASFAVPSSTAACSANVPTFEQVLDASSRIVIGRVTEARNTDDNPFPETYVISVERVLKGEAGESLTVDQRAYLCGDGLTPDDVGLRILIATDLKFHVETLSPFWWQFPDGRFDGWAETPPGVSSLDDLADRIASALPDTATAGKTSRAVIYGGHEILLIGIAALGIFLLRGPWPRRARRSS